MEFQDELLNLNNNEVDSAIVENLKNSRTYDSNNIEKRLAYLCDLADDIKSKVENIAEGDIFLHSNDDVVRNSICDMLTSSLSYIPSPQDTNVREVMHKIKLTNRTDCYYICDKLLEKSRNQYSTRNVMQVLFGDIPEIKPKNKKIAFVRNVQTGKAFELFAKYVFGAITSYYDSYAYACEAVAEGECSFGIIPLRNSVDGRLNAFYKMLDRYELGILLCTDIENQNGDVTRYALVYSRQGLILASGTTKLECKIHFENCKEIGDVIDMADFFGVDVESVESIQVPQYDDGMTFSFCFTFDNGSLDRFVFCLQSLYPQILPVGLYTQIEGAKN